MYRVINTAKENENAGPHGLKYVNDASRPWAVLRNRGRSEICVGRYSQEKLAKRYVSGKLAAIKMGEAV